MWNELTEEALEWAKKNNTEDYRRLLSREKWCEMYQSTKDPEMKKVYKHLSNKEHDERRIQREYEKYSYKQKITKLNNSYKDVGSIEIKSGKMFVSDPCYSANSQDNGLFQNVVNGTWKAKVFYRLIDGWGLRVCNFTIEHEDSSPSGDKKKADFLVGVDSGLAGFGEHDHFLERNLELGNKDWYRETLLPALRQEVGNMEDYAVVDNAFAVSSSGFGDGAYECFYWTNEDGEVCKAVIEFVREDEI